LPSRAYDKDLDDWLTLRARTHADRPALITGGRTVLYRELDELAASCARRLAALGAGEGDRVATTLSPGLDFAVLLHALPRLGAVLVPLNTRDPYLEVESVLVVAEPLRGQEADVPLRSEVDPDAPQVVIHTSGTTAQPKPVELTYSNFAASAVASAWNLGVDPDDRWLCVMPLFHVGGLSILTRSAIYGTCAVVHDGFDSGAVRDSIESGEATLVSLVATMLRRLRTAGLERAPGLRAALIGGGPVPRDLLDWGREAGLPLLQTYGMTETCSQIATAGAGDTRARALPGVELDTTAEGEILARGPMVAPGAVAGDGWLHTGDRGHIDDEGFLHVEGRIKDTIVTGGENVAAPEVEEALLSHPAVTDAAVVGRPDPEWGEVVTAFVVLSDETPDDDLRAHCRERLAGYKVPRAFERVSELPRTASGKLLKGRLNRVPSR
jgi:O-succinylbenzoic acid--CoA ligase